MSTPNPNCACGCGQEVSRPWGKFIHGHYSPKKLSDEQIAQIKKLLDNKVWYEKIQKMFGVSYSIVAAIAYDRIHGTQHFYQKCGIQLHPRKILRKEDLEEIEQKRKEKKAWIGGKRQYKEVRKWLREKSPIR